MNTVTNTNTLISGAITGDKAKYQIKINPKGTIELDEIVAQVATKIKEPESIVRNVLTETGNAIGNSIAGGFRISLDNRIRFELGARGSATSEDAHWDPSRNALIAYAVLAGDLRNAAKNIVPENVLKPVSIQILGVQDAETLEQNMLTDGHTALLQGKNLKINKDNAEEGVYLVKGESEYKLEVTDSTAGTIDATLTGVPAGEGYRLEVRGRAGLGTNRMLVTAKMNDITVKAA